MQEIILSLLFSVALLLLCVEQTFSQGVVYADSVKAAANSKQEADYTVPSFTRLRKAMVSADSTIEPAIIANLADALNKLQLKEIPYSIVININEDPTTKMAFNWFTNAGIYGGKVQIVKGVATNHSQFATPLMTINAKVDPVNNLNYSVTSNGLSALAGIPDNTLKSYMSNKALATGLAPNTTHSYRVGKEGGWSDIGKFKTANINKDEFSFIYTTDPQANTDDMFNTTQKTTHVAQTMYPNANFWLQCGDLVDTPGSASSEWEWEQLFLTQQDIFLNNPFAPTQGNHDISANKNFTSHFNTDSTAFDYAMSTTPGGIYSYVYGDALFLAISYEDYSVPGYLNSIAKWMRSEVNAHPEVKWRIVYYHKTMYTGSVSHQSDSDGKIVRDRMAPLFDSLKIDLALQGHDHIYEVIGPVKNKQLVPGAVSNQITVTFDARENVTGLLKGIFDVKEGTLYFLNNSAGEKKYEPASKEQMDTTETITGITKYFGLFTGRFGQTGRPTFSNIKVSTDTVSITTYEVFGDGTAALLDAFKVIKSSTPTGNHSIGENQAIIVYPNPVKETLNIRFANPVRATVEIYNFNGTIVRNEIIEGTSTLRISDLDPGFYFLKVKAENAVHVVKFVKE